VRKAALHETHEKQLSGNEGHRQPERDRCEENEKLGEILRDQVVKDALDVSEYDAPLLDCLHDRVESAIKKHDVGHFARRIHFRIYRNADIRRLQGRRIIYAVTEHGDNMTLLLE